MKSPAGGADEVLVRDALALAGVALANDDYLDLP